MIKGWKPIDSAPRDGTRILVCKEFPEFEQVSIDFCRDGLWWRSTTYNQPKFWQPLPTAEDTSAVIGEKHS